MDNLDQVEQCILVIGAAVDVPRPNVVALQAFVEVMPWGRAEIPIHIACVDALKAKRLLEVSAPPELIEFQENDGSQALDV